MIFFMFKKVSESHWCKEIKKLLWCSGKIIDSVLLDDEILNFLDQNILADFRHCICIPQKLKIFFEIFNLFMYTYLWSKYLNGFRIILVIYIFLVLFLKKINSENEILLTTCNNAQLLLRNIFQITPIFWKSTIKSNFRNCPVDRTLTHGQLILFPIMCYKFRYGQT